MEGGGHGGIRLKGGSRFWSSSCILFAFWYSSQARYTSIPAGMMPELFFLGPFLRMGAFGSGILPSFIFWALIASRSAAVGGVPAMFGFDRLPP